MLKKILYSGLAFLLLTTIAFIVLWNIRPRPDALVRYELEKKTEASLPFTVTFLGNANLLFDDGENVWMTDAFFTRPSVKEILFNAVQPREAVIREYLDKANIVRLDIIVPVHSHFDHAMDAAMVADMTNAKLWGSTSTLNIGRGYGLDESQMMVPKADSMFSLGKFKIQFIKSNHLKYPDAKLNEILLQIEIEEPLITPTSIFDYKEGDSYTILVEHDSIKFAIQGSAGFRENSLPEFDADILFLAITGLETTDHAYRDNYQKHLVNPLNPEVIVPIHWDDFTTPLGEKLKTPNLLFKWRFKSDLGQAFKIIETRSPDKSIKVLQPWVKYNILDILD